MLPRAGLRCSRIEIGSVRGYEVAIRYAETGKRDHFPSRVKIICLRRAYSAGSEGNTCTWQKARYEYDPKKPN